MAQKTPLVVGSCSRPSRSRSTALGVDPSPTAEFVLAAVALVPLAWLIGEATEHAAEHTGPGIGGFLNASFGNAPELIIALIAVDDGLPDVVRGSIIGSVVSNLLLVLGPALLAGRRRAELDRRSLFLQLGARRRGASRSSSIPSIPGWHGDPDRHSLASCSRPDRRASCSCSTSASTWLNLRRRHASYASPWRPTCSTGWSTAPSLVVLGDRDGRDRVRRARSSSARSRTSRSAVGLSRLLRRDVIVAIVGNAAEHGGAIVVARRGKIKLATEIAVSSSAQVALSRHARRRADLVRRPTAAGARVPADRAGRDGRRDGRSSPSSSPTERPQRWEGALLVVVYVAVVAAFYLAGDR